MSANGYADQPKTHIYVTDGERERHIATTADEETCKLLISVLNREATFKNQGISFSCQQPHAKV